MAPPGVNSFYDHMDTLSSFGSCYSSFSLSLKSSMHSPVSPPAMMKKRPLSALSPPLRRAESDILSILSDHDYVTKPIPGLGMSGVKDDSLSTEESDGEEAPTEGADDSNTGAGDAMLSSAADFSNETMTDTDFLHELDSIDFTDLDPCGDMAMEDSFEDFIESVLDNKSRAPFFGTDLDNDTVYQDGHEAVILGKEDFLGFLGLKPSRQNPSSRTVSTENNSLEVVLGDTPQSERVPTKKCSSCSPSETCLRVVYSTAASYSYTTVPSSPNNNQTTIRQSCFPYSTLGLMSPEHTSPLSIDTSFDFTPGLSAPLCDSSDITMEDAVKPQGIEDDATRDLLKWLHGEQQMGTRVDSEMTEQPTKFPVVAPSLDPEAFVDLNDYALESNCQRTYTQLNKELDYSCGQLKLSFLSDSRDNFQYCGYMDDSILSDSSTKSSMNSVSSQDSYPSPALWSCPETLSPSFSPRSNTMELASSESTQLALLNLFSDENASALHSIEDSDLRFV